MHSLAKIVEDNPERLFVPIRRISRIVYTIFLLLGIVLFVIIICFLVAPGGEVN